MQLDLKKMHKLRKARMKKKNGGVEESEKERVVNSNGNQ
jgi:hypothetical protein